MFWNSDAWCCLTPWVSLKVFETLFRIHSAYCGMFIDLDSRKKITFYSTIYKFLKMFLTFLQVVFLKKSWKCLLILMNPLTVYVKMCHGVKWLVVITTTVPSNGFILVAWALQPNLKANGTVPSASTYSRRRNDYLQDIIK